MSRSVKEWVGKTDDTKAPPRVRLRVFQRENGICHLSRRPILAGELWELHHGLALINGGKNVESNLFPVLADKHREQTKLDVAEKARVAAKAKAHVGATRSAGKIASRGFDRHERKHEGRAALKPREMFK